MTRLAVLEERAWIYGRCGTSIGTGGRLLMVVYVNEPPDQRAFRYELSGREIGAELAARLLRERE